MARRLPLSGAQGTGLAMLLVPVLPGRTAALLVFAGVFPRYMVLSLVIANSMGLKGGPPCEMGPGRVVAEVSAASLPFWHLIWDQQPKCPVVCTAVIPIIAVLLGAAQGWSALCLLSSFPSRRVLSGALQQACEWLLDQAIYPFVHRGPLRYTHFPEHCTK